MAEQRVLVTDIEMSFLDMVVFMVKWAIATIPAMLVLFLLGWLFLGTSVLLFPTVLTNLLP